VIAHALNERFAELGVHHPVSYLAQFGGEDVTSGPR
jgi:hypothetical protein